MTSKIVNFPENGMTMVINRLTDYTVQHFSGLSDVPHLCVKVKHNNGFAWFGLSIVNVVDNSIWNRRTEDAIRERFMNAMSQVIDLTEMDSDINLLMRSIQDVCTNRKRPVMFGTDSNEFIQINSINNIRIELYRNEVKSESATYGGYFMVVQYGKLSFPVMLYHRGIILHNYITREDAQQLVKEELLSKFPEFFYDINKFIIPYKSIAQITRNRNKWTKIK